MRGGKAPKPATCVCPPLDKGFSTATPSTVFQPPFSTFYRQGGREDLQGSAQRSSLQDPRKRKLITSVYLQPKLLTTLSNSCFFASMVVCVLLPTNPFFQCRCAAALIIEQSCINIVKQYNCADSFTFPFHHHFSWKLS